jgi:hypothetical protein
MVAMILGIIDPTINNAMANWSVDHIMPMTVV